MGDATWVRHGECDACGFCCRALCKVTLEFDSSIVADPDFCEVRGIELADGRAVKTLQIVDPCSKLDQDTNLCTIHPTRPRTCVEFPPGPDAVVGIPCTYWFRNSETGEVVAGTRAIVDEP